MKVAFVIPHMGRTDYLRQTLRSIQGQHGFDGEVEVIVVSKDEISGEELWSSDQFDKSKRLRCLTVDSSLSISAQRNVGVRETDGELIAFIDADIELAPAWLKTMSALLFENDQRVIVSAAQIPSNSATLLERIRTDQSNVHVDTDVAHLPGRNLLMRREHVNQLNGFPEHLATCEDYFFTGQAAALGALYYSTDTHYVHLGEDKLILPMFAKEIWRGESNIRSIAGRSVQMDELPSFIVPMWVLLSWLGLFITLFLWLPVWVLVMGVCVLLPNILYAIRLKLKSSSKVNVIMLSLFYLWYFTARGIGMIVGFFRDLLGRKPL